MSSVGGGGLICHLVVPQSTFGHSQGDRFSPDLIIVYAKIPKAIRTCLALISNPINTTFIKSAPENLLEESTVKPSNGGQNNQSQMRQSFLNYLTIADTSIMEKNFKIRRCPLFRGFTVFYFLRLLSQEFKVLSISRGHSCQFIFGQIALKYMLMYLNFIHKNLVVAKFRPDIITHLEFNSVTKQPYL